MGVAWELQHTLEKKESSEEIQFKLRNKLETIRAKNPFKTIHRSLESVQTNEAHEKLSKLNKSMHSLESELGIKRGDELDKIFQEHNRLIQEATAFSKPKELIQTLSDKVNRLESLANSRRWGNLTKMSQRMKARLGQLQVNARVESPLVRFMQSDLTAMTSLITGSTLEENDKNEVLRQLEGIRQEIAMLLDLHQSRKGFGVLIQRSDEAVGRWAARADLAVGTLKHRAHNAVLTSLHHLWAIGVFLIFGWFVIGIIWAMAKRSQQKLQDDNLLALLMEGVLSDKPMWHNLTGPARRDELQHAMKIIRKRMSLGEDFQAAMPFASVLVNHELKLIWGNTLFCEQFGIDEQELTNEFNSWESIITRLSGPDFDPIKQALETSAPGTWQVKWQMEDGVAIPLEMHVSPIEGKKHNKVLVAFYPMAMMQDAIQSQAQIVMAPVRLALEALENESWSIETEKNLAPQWQQVGLALDWEKLSRTIHRMDQARNDLILQAQRLENEKHDYMKSIVDLSAVLEQRGSAMRTQMQSLKDVRDSLVSLDQLGADLGMDHAALLTSTRNLMKRFDHIYEASRSLSDRMGQAKDAVSQLEKTKLAYRQGKLELQDTKQEMVQLHNEFIDVLPEMDHRAQELAGEMKDALMKLDRAITQLDNKMTGFDVQITKLAMAFTGPVPEFDRYLVSIDVAAHERVAEEIAQAMQEDQELIIERLKNLVDELRTDTQQCISAHKLQLNADLADHT
jgi:hypothetical protein